MAQRSRFFDSVGGDRVYNSDAWAQVVYGLTGDGVVTGRANELAVSENSPAAMNVRVNTGVAFVQGYYFEVFTAQEVLTIGAAHATLSRIDRVVVRRDLTNRTAVLAVIVGTNAASPVAPNLTQNVAGTYEIPLAQVLVSPGVASIVNAKITDERGVRATSTGIGATLDPTTGHAHTGLTGGGRKVTYGDLLGTPSVFAPSDHAHAGAGTGGTVPYANITGKPATFAPTAHAAAHGSGGSDAVTVPWGSVSGKPATFSPTSHNHPWADVTGEPATYDPTAHAASHAAGGSDAIGAATINAWKTGSQGGGVSGVKIWVGTTTPVGPDEGDVWIKG